MSTEEQVKDNIKTFTEEKFLYENGISDYIKERVGDSAKTEPVLWHLETQGRDRDDKDEYKLKADYTGTLSQFNEVVNATADDWNTLAEKTISAIRLINPTRKIIVGCTEWNNPPALAKLKVFDDENVIFVSFSIKSTYLWMPGSPR